MAVLTGSRHHLQLGWRRGGGGGNLADRRPCAVRPAAIHPRLYQRCGCVGRYRYALCRATAMLSPCGPRHWPHRPLGSRSSSAASCGGDAIPPCCASISRLCAAPRRPIQSIPVPWRGLQPMVGWRLADQPVGLAGGRGGGGGHVWRDGGGGIVAQPAMQ